MSAEDRRRAMIGIMLAIGAYMLFPVGDAVVKTLGGQYPGTGIAIIRYCASSLGLGLLSFWRDPDRFWSFPDPWMQIGRGAALAATTGTFWVSLTFLPLGEATVIFYLNPVIIVILSGLILGEKVPVPVWFATIMAFAGVLLVIHPDGARIGLAGLLPLASAFSMASLVIMNRVSARSEKCSALHSQFLISVCGLGFATVIATLGHWSGLAALHLSFPTPSILARGLLIAGLAAIGHFLLFFATQRVSAGRIAPFAYTQLLVAILLGMLLFDDHPDAMTGIGAAMIIFAGLVTWRVQRGVVIRVKEAD
ncbi:MAG: DMT family transporter [Sphingobium sp.]